MGGTMLNSFLVRGRTGLLVAQAWMLPLLVLPSLLMDAMELPKLAALALTTGPLAAILVARRLVAREPAAPLTPVTLPLGAFLLTAALSLPGTAGPAAGLYAFVYFGALLTSSLAAATLPSREPVLKAAMAAGAVVALYALGQFVGFEPLPWSPHFKPRVFSTLGNPVFLGGFIAALFPITFARWLYADSEEEKDMLTLLLAALGFALFLTWTRGSLAAVAAATALQLAVLAAVPGGREVLRANRFWILTLAVLTFVGVIILSSPLVTGKTSVPFGDRLRDALDFKGFSVRFRMVTTEAALRAVRSRPVQGTGIGAYGAHYPWLRMKTAAARGVPDRFFASQEAYVHNEHVQFLSEHGVLGLGAWIWLLLCFFRWAAWMVRRETAPGERGGAKPPARDGFALGALGCVAGVSLDSLFNFPLHIVPTAWLFFIAMGMLASPPGVRAPRKAPSEPEAAAVPPAPPAARDPADRRRTAVAAVLVAACGLATLNPVIRHTLADISIREGDHYYGGNNFEMAEAYYSRGALLTPLNRFIQLRRSVSLVQYGRFEYMGHSLDLSIVHAKRALALGYQDENVYKSLSDAYGKKYMVGRAITALSAANTLNPLREDVANNLSYYLAERGQDTARAVELARSAVERAPQDPRYLDTLGYALLKAGRKSEARSAFRKALLALPPGSGNVMIEMARKEVLDHLREAGAPQ